MKFNDQQWQAISAPLKNIAVIAGAGSGKTRVLTHRFKYLVDYYEFNPESLIMVTFTNRAAAEMKYRLRDMMDRSTKHWQVGTFHGLAHHWLRERYEAALLPQNFQILDSSDQRIIIGKIIKLLGYNNKVLTPSICQNEINKWKDEGIRHEQIETETLDENQKKTVYEHYQKYCDERGLVDFGELLLRWYEVLVYRPNVLGELKNWFRNILVDEFQDANKIQRMWLEIMTKETGKAFVVGDDDQSIYSWRGASFLNLKSFSYDFEDVEVVKLEENYRSTKLIIWAANNVVSKNTTRFEKVLMTNNEVGQTIREHCARDEEGEARFVAEKIKQWKEKGNDLKNCAILYRSNAQSRVFEEVFINEALPYKIYGGLKFFERQEIKDVISYLRIAQDFNDDESFERAVQVPPQGIGEQTVEKISEFAKENKLSLFNASLLIISNSSKFLPPKIKLSLKMFCSKIEQIAKIVKIKELDKLINETLVISGLFQHYKARENIELNRVENLEELVNATNGFEVRNSELTPLQNFLAHVALETRDKESNPNQDAVQMMTIHNSKGLEFDLVFIVGFEDGIFPNENSKGSGLEEERRLAYVAITRARKFLYFTWAETRTVRGFSKTNKHSEFIDEINQDYIVSNRYKIQPTNKGSIIL